MVAPPSLTEAHKTHGRPETLTAGRPHEAKRCDAGWDRSGPPEARCVIAAKSIRSQLGGGSVWSCHSGNQGSVTSMFVSAI